MIEGQVSHHRNCPLHSVCWVSFA